jgi:hypothetical protein
MVDAELHDGGSSSFTLLFLVVTRQACSRDAGRIPFAAPPWTNEMASVAPMG